MNRPRTSKSKGTIANMPLFGKAGTGGWTRDSVLWEVEEGSTRRGWLWYFRENEDGREVLGFY